MIVLLPTRTLRRTSSVPDVKVEIEMEVPGGKVMSTNLIDMIDLSRAHAPAPDEIVGLQAFFRPSSERHLFLGGGFRCGGFLQLFDTLF